MDTDSVRNKYIVYCKEDDPDNWVPDLSDFLCHCGVNCDLDVYHAAENIVNWDQWHAKKMEDCATSRGFILLICSRLLIDHLTNSQMSQIHMHSGLVSNQTLLGLISKFSPYVIPVFLEQHNRLTLPANLSMRTTYTVPMTRLIEVHQQCADVRQTLGSPGLESLRSLVSRLTGQLEPPPPVSAPIGLPLPRAKDNPVKEEVPQPRQPIEGEVSDEYLLKLSEKIVGYWSRLGIRLGVSFITIEKIRRELSQSGQQQAYLMLMHWKSTHKGPATKQQILDKLDELKIGGLGKF